MSAPSIQAPRAEPVHLTPPTTATRLERAWPRLAVVEATLTPLAMPAGHPPHHLARAVIRLGPLAPADLCVHLDGVSATDDRHTTLARLWSVQRYDPFTVLFETTLPAALLAPYPALTLRLRPCTPEGLADAPSALPDHLHPLPHPLPRAD